MSLDTYANLKTSIANWLNRTDLTSQIPDFISLCEAKLRRSKAVRGVTRRPLTLNASTVNLPSDFETPKDLFFDGSTYYGQIELVNEGRIADLKMTYGTSGVPRFYSVIQNGTAIALAPEPLSGQDFSATLVYVAEMEALSDTVTSNWILTDHPDVYLYGALLEAEGYLKNDPRIATWKSQYREAMAELRNYIEDREWGEQPLVIRPKRPIG